MTATREAVGQGTAGVCPASRRSSSIRASACRTTRAPGRRASPAPSPAGSRTRWMGISCRTWARRRVEGGFQHIVQRDATDVPNAKYFEVTTQDGTKYTYGKTAAAREYDPAAPSHVSAWHLESVVDVYGNGMTYTYSRIARSLNQTACNAGGICAHELVPSQIEYTTHSSAAPTKIGRASCRERV